MGNCNFKTEKEENEKTPTFTKNLFLLHYIIGKGGFGKVRKSYLLLLSTIFILIRYGK